MQQGSAGSDDGANVSGGQSPTAGSCDSPTAGAGSQLVPYRPWTAVRRVMDGVGRDGCAGSGGGGGACEGAELARQGAQQGAAYDSSLDTAGTVALPWDRPGAHFGGGSQPARRPPRPPSSNSGPGAPPAVAAAARAPTRLERHAVPLQPPVSQLQLQGVCTVLLLRHLLPSSNQYSPAHTCLTHKQPPPLAPPCPAALSSPRLDPRSLR